MQNETTTPTVINPDEALPQFEKMICKLAWNITNRYGVPFEETKAEAEWAFVKACDDWTKLKGWTRGSKFTSWCYFGISMKLMDMVKKRASDRLVLTEMNEELCGEAAPTSAHTLLDTVQTLPQDARDVVAMLLETPAELVGVAMTPKQLLKKVKALLVERHGKTTQQVEDACRVLRNHFQQEWAS